MKIALTPEEKINLESRHQNETDGRVRDRIKSILLRDEGWSVSKIAQALRLHNDTVSRFICDYLKEKKLSSNHKGSVCYLSDEQNSKLIDHLQEHMYDKAVEIIHYVKENYAVEYSISGITKWLKKNNFSYKQPKGQPAKADAEKQKEFIEKYDEIREKTPENEPILFTDGVHPTMETKISRGWVYKGIDKLIPTTASRTRMNIMGAIELKTMNVVSQEYKTINGESITSFLSKIKKAYPNAPKIHIILDQAGYHRSQEVQEYVKNSSIELHFLPPYSPNLNPIERLWKVMNEKVRNNYFFKSAKEFRERITNFFEITLPEIKETLRPRINDNFNIIGAVK
jgi:transposase